MKTLRIDPDKPETELISIAVKLLGEGKILIYPTDTVYGLGCSMDSSSVGKIYEIKKRSRTNPLSIACSDLEMAREHAHLSQEDEERMKACLHEPYTFIAKKKDRVPDIVTAGRDTVGIRIPDHEVARRIISACGGPIITTSANVSGGAPPAAFKDISADLLSRVDLAIDSGRCKIGRPSKVIDLRSGKALR